MSPLRPLRRLEDGNVRLLATVTGAPVNGLGDRGLSLDISGSSNVPYVPNSNSNGLVPVL